MPYGDETAYGSLAGMGTGAALGALGFLGPAGWAAGLMGAGIGGGLGGTLGGLFGKKKKGSTIDIGAELAKINALFEQQKAAARSGINQDAAEARRASASNLAARGTYSSPVSEYTFGALDRSRMRALAESDANIGAKQAEMQGNIFYRLTEMENENRKLEAQRQAAIAGGLGGLSGALLQAGLNYKPTGADSPSAFNTDLWGKQYRGGANSSFFGPSLGVDPRFSNLIYPSRGIMR